MVSLFDVISLIVSLFAVLRRVQGIENDVLLFGHASFRIHGKGSLSLFL